MFKRFKQCRQLFCQQKSGGCQHPSDAINLLIQPSAIKAKKEENKAFAVGHFATGYIVSKLAAQATKTRLNIPLVFALSVIPDIDLLIPFLEHRGPTHSLIVALVIFVPIFAVYRKGAVPYFAALIQHSLLGDYVAGQAQLLWPLTSQQYGMEICIRSATNLTLEWSVFILSMVVMLKARDMQTFFQPNNSNLILAIPTFTVLLPTFLAFPLDVPISLLPPHLIYLAIFIASLLITIKNSIIV